MRILLKNLGALPYSLDIGDWDYGAMVRPLLAPSGSPGDTIDIGDRVSPWDLNVQLYIRQLVVPDGSTRIVTPVTDGYEVTATPPGQLKATFLGAPNDLVFLFFGDTDGKVKVDAADTTADYLFPKLAAGTGIALTVLNPGGNEQVRISAAGSSGITEAEHETLRQLIHFIDEGPGHGFLSGAFKEVIGGIFPTTIIWWESAAKLKRIVDKTITRSGGGATNLRPTPIQYRVYDTDGVTVLQTISDAVTYSGAAEVSRTRTIT